MRGTLTRRAHTLPSGRLVRRGRPYRGCRIRATVRDLGARVERHSRRKRRESMVLSSCADARRGQSQTQSAPKSTKRVPYSIPEIPLRSHPHGDHQSYSSELKDRHRPTQLLTLKHNRFTLKLGHTHREEVVCRTVYDNVVRPLLPQPIADRICHLREAS